MNKNEISMNRIRFLLEGLGVDKNNYEEDCNNMQELVDRATPKKVKVTIISEEHGSYQCDCPVCGRFISVNIKNKEYKYCDECGQAIDWSDE